MFFTDILPTPPLLILLDSTLRVRRDLYVDPLVAEPWSCDPDRCRPRLGPNLCCKVQTRCPHLRDERCTIHGAKPFLCDLFPLDLVRIAGARLVTTPANLDFFQTGWSRYDRDMLRCFEGVTNTRRSMFETQRAILSRVFTKAELLALGRTLEAAFSGTVPGG